ncbi:MAG TPA: ABC transporter ATP-binding protein [Bryobacteraceae bacterium]|nr:ABC transporter ATP-binding protein [Bryobacteraceae bacterium]
MAGRLELTNVSVAFGAVEVIRKLSLTISDGDFVAIIGPSGCGKTTLLNLLAGFERPSAGSIDCQGQVRMVYQEDGLFPWATVTENIELGLRHIADRSERRRQIGELLKVIHIEGFEHHYPRQLSGGMRQRVELARALAGGSDVLLMDEPFSALDYLTRLRMRNELARVLSEMPRTAVLVTHDIEEAAQLADRIVVLTQRPARVRREFRISTPRPRELTNPEVVDAMGRILDALDIGSATGPK